MNEDRPVIKAGILQCSGSLLESLHCHWKIGNFSTLDSTVGSGYACDSIPSVEEANVRWYMQIYPGGISAQHEGTVQCVVGCENKLRGTITVKFSFAIRNSDNEEIVNTESRFDFGPSTCFDYVETPRNILLDQLRDDILIITADMTYSRTIAKNRKKTRILGMVSPYMSLPDNYGDFLPERIPSDAFIVVDGESIPVHRAVLCAHSKVFATMFAEEKFEDDDPRIEISDFDVDMVMPMVHFMHTGTVGDMDVEKALSLLRIGTKFRVDGLVSHCRGFLAAMLNTPNRIEAVLLAAASSSSDEIRNHAIEYICENVSAEDLESGYSGLKENRRVLFYALVRMKEIEPP